MIDPGKFYVISIGRMYARGEDGMWGRQLEHALSFTDPDKAQRVADKLRRHAEREKKPIQVWEVSVRAYEPPVAKAQRGSR